MGDIIIFDEYDERIFNGELISDRFYRVEQEHIDSIFSGAFENAVRRTKDELKRYLAERTELLPAGVVVHVP